jgi:hypothetical protein
MRGHDAQVSAARTGATCSVRYPSKHIGKHVQEL